jgi:hypothetical protein
MGASLPIVASALGALIERCHGRPSTWLLPWNSSVRKVVDFLTRLYEEGLEVPSIWSPLDGLPPVRAFYIDEYLRPARVAAALRKTYTSQRAAAG